MNETFHGEFVRSVLSHGKSNGHIGLLDPVACARHLLEITIASHVLIREMCSSLLSVVSHSDSFSLSLSQS